MAGEYVMVELQKREFHGSSGGPHLLITAGVHGDEFEGITAVHRLMKRIVASELRGRVTLVPVVNESAYQQRARCGSDGLDLARTCPGNHQGSETQQVAAALVELIQRADLYIDLHSGGLISEVYPLAGYMLVPNTSVLETQRTMANVFGLPLVWGTSPDLDGRSLSAARDAEVPAIYVEYLGSGRCNPKGAQSFVDGCLNVMAEFSMFGQAADDRSQPVIHEDDASGSGHMQLCYPAPATGLFEPVVRLGQRVEVGEPLGILSDPFSGDSVTVAATESGAVVVLRTYPRVDAGDSLAVIVKDAGGLPRFESIQRESNE